MYFEIFPTEGFDVRSATRYEEKSTNKKKKKKGADGEEEREIPTFTRRKAIMSDTR